MSKGKVKEKETQSLGDISEVRKITKQSKEDHGHRIESAADKAFNELTWNQDMGKISEYIKNAAKEGKTRLYLYKWQYVERGEENKYTFDNFKIIDLIRKSSLMDKLKKYFNPEGKIDGYQVGWKKFVRRYQDEPSEYGIYVSWYQPSEERLKEIKEKEKEEVKEKEEKKWKKATK